MFALKLDAQVLIPNEQIQVNKGGCLTLINSLSLHLTSYLWLSCYSEWPNYYASCYLSQYPLASAREKENSKLFTILLWLAFLLILKHSKHSSTTYFPHSLQTIIYLYRWNKIERNIAVPEALFCHVLTVVTTQSLHFPLSEYQLFPLCMSLAVSH